MNIHGHTTKTTSSPTYRSWQSMKDRCYNPNNPHYSNYGGRGIDVAPGWFYSFTNFLAYLGKRPKGTTLERINNSLGYWPDNCKWATKSEQQINQRLRKTNTSGHKNIHWYPPYQQYQVQICRQGIRKTIGYFKTIEEALKAKLTYLQGL